MNNIGDSDILFTYATEGILICNEKGSIVRINPAAAALFGYSQEELHGSTIEILVPDRCVAEHASMRREYQRQPVVKSFGQRATVVGKRKDGTEFPLEVSLSPYERDGSQFVIAFVIDITYRKHAEEQLRLHSEELQREVRSRTLILEEAVHQLEKTKLELHATLDKERELSLLKSRFVTIASHEFRTPLATILSSLALVRKYADLNETEKRNKHIERIKSNIANLNDILDDFLSLSRLEEGAVESSQSTIELSAFLSTIIDEIRPSAEGQHEIEFQADGEQIVSLDAKALRTVLVNLIGNALKYSEPGRGVEIRSHSSAGTVVIEVCDHGIGIPAEDQAHIFERFYRAHNVMHIKGTGLGLSIVAKFVELLHGQISLQSTEHVGTTVKITIPYEKDPTY